MTTPSPSSSGRSIGPLRRIVTAMWGSRAGRRVEEHPVIAVLVVALVSRVAVALAISLFSDGFIFPDSHTYHRLAEQRALGDTAGWTQFEHRLFRSVLVYLAPLTALYKLVGAHVLVGQMVSVVWGSLVGPAVTLLALRELPRRWAIVAGLTTAVMPSQVFWSALTLKDAAVWSCFAIVAVLAHRLIVDPPSPMTLVGAAGVLLALAYLRDYTAVVASWALVISVTAGALARRSKPAVSTAMGTILLVTVIMQLGGLGPLGIDFVADNVRGLADRRADAAVGAASAIADVTTTTSTTSTTSTTLTNTTLPTRTTATPGSTSGGEGTLDSAIDDVAVTRNIRYLPRGLVAVMLEPFPWSPGRNLGVRLASVESVVWYPLLVCAAVGVLSLRRRFNMLAFPVVAGVGMATVQALTEGNIGTAYRHRGELVWVVVLLAVVGLVDRVVGRHGVAESAPEVHRGAEPAKVHG